MAESTLPTICPSCGHSCGWEYIPGNISGYHCQCCGYAAELYSDSETLGRIKYLPEVKDEE